MIPHGRACAAASRNHSGRRRSTCEERRSVGFHRGQIAFTKSPRAVRDRPAERAGLRVSQQNCRADFFEQRYNRVTY